MPRDSYQSVDMVAYQNSRFGRQVFSSTWFGRLEEIGNNLGIRRVSNAVASLLHCPSWFQGAWRVVAWACRLGV